MFPRAWYLLFSLASQRFVKDGNSALTGLEECSGIFSMECCSGRLELAIFPLFTSRQGCPHAQRIAQIDVQERRLIDEWVSFSV